MTQTNTTVRLAKRPQGLPDPSTWAIADEPVPALAEGQVLVKTSAISLDPAMRGWINEGRSYIPPVALGDVMRALVVGEVVESHDPSVAVGTKVEGQWGVQAYAVLPANTLQRIEPGELPIERFLGVLGMPGMTGYFGVLEVGQLKAGDTLVVSAASGAVGALVGQVGKIKGCRVVGLAGGPEKCAYVTGELGFDACIDYKAGDVQKALADACPKGIDVYFDNVGGEILEAVLNLINRHARVVICGAISGYNDSTGPKPPRNYLSLLINSARMEGFVVFDFITRYAEGRAQVMEWLQAGRIKAREDVQHGLHRFPEVLNMLYKSENFGKLVLKP